MISRAYWVYRCRFPGWQKVKTKLQVKKGYEQINARLKEEIKGKLDIIDKLNLQIICVEKAKKNVEDVLHDTKTDFQDFIDRLPESIKGQVGYMTRPIYIDEIGRVATII